MTEFMQVLFDYVSESRVKNFLPLEQDHFCGAHLETLENTLLDVLNPSQKEVWEEWYSAKRDYFSLYEKALFQATWQLAREV